jgi:urease accessory protein
VLDRDWLILQLTDSAFPTGAFAHSGGLEAAWQIGDVPTPAELTAFLAASLQQAADTTAAIVAMTTREPGRFAELDAFADAMLLNAVANRASRSQGQALLTATQRIFCPPALGELARSAGTPQHLAPVFGVVHAALGVDERNAVSNFLFVTLRGLVSAAVRLGIVGPLEGQGMQFDLARSSPQWAERALSICNVDEITATSPLLDYYQSLQDLLYSRLFIS